MDRNRPPGSHLAERFRFDPEDGTIIREPEGSGYGYWAGGHKVSVHNGTYALFYRLRGPLESGRGGLCRVALSTNGIDFDDVWEASKDELAASSIEVGHCVAHDDDEWRLYVSYEYAATSSWRIDLISASHPEAFDAQSRRTVLSPGDYGVAWIKDPVVLRDGDGYRLYAAVPDRSSPPSGPRRKARALDATVLAASDDGIYFPEIRYVFEASGADTWDGRRARINSLVHVDGGYLATYDGGRTFYDNYEEWAGLAWSPDGVAFERIHSDGPWVRSPYGSVRYVYGLAEADRLLWYYEYTRSDGSHDLRVAIVPKR